MSALDKFNRDMANMRLEMAKFYEIHNAKKEDLIVKLDAARKKRNWRDMQMILARLIEMGD